MVCKKQTGARPFLFYLSVRRVVGVKDVVTPEILPELLLFVGGGEDYHLAADEFRELHGGCIHSPVDA